MTNERRLIRLEAEIRSRTSTLTLDDGREVHISPLAWVTLVDVPIEQMAADYEGSEAPPLTPEQERLKGLFSRARFDPAWGDGERAIWRWVHRHQFGGSDEPIHQEASRN